MEDWKTLYMKGVRYYRGAMNLAEYRKFSDPVILGTFNLASEYLLSALVSLKDVFILHGGVAHLVFALKEMGEVPDYIEKLSKTIITLSLKCSCGKNDLCIDYQQMQNLVSLLGSLLQWVAQEIELYHTRNNMEQPAIQI